MRSWVSTLNCIPSWVLTQNYIQCQLTVVRFLALEQRGELQRKSSGTASATVALPPSWVTTFKLNPVLGIDGNYIHRLTIWWFLALEQREEPWR